MTMIGYRGPFQMPDGMGPLAGSPMFNAPMDMPQPQPKAGKGRMIAGIIADMLAGAMGRPGLYAQQMLHERRDQSDFERGEQQYQRRRADNREDKLWELEHTPKAPYRWESNDGSLMEMGPDGRPRVAYQDPTPKEKWVFDPVRGYVNINAPSSVPAAPVGKLTPLGGPTPQASGGFRY